MSDLLEKLEAAIAETERIALAAKSHTGDWYWSHGFGEMCNDRDCPYGALIDKAGPDDDAAGTVLMQVHGYDISQPWEGAEHIALNDPKRVLRRVARDRKLLELAKVLREDGQDNAADHLVRLLAEDYEIEVPEHG